MIVLVGLPGAGKSNVAGRLAQVLRGSVTDVDARIEASEERSITDIFATDGEERFRALELEHTLAALQSDAAVVSLGGGAVLTKEIRDALKGHQVVWLQVSAPQAARRIGLAADRPLLVGNMRSRLVQLARERHHLYDEVATLAIDTDKRDVERVVNAILARITPHVITVRTANPYPVEVVAGARQRLAGAVSGADRVALLHPPALAQAAAELADTIEARTTLIELPDGEGAKTPAVIAQCWDRLAAEGFTRSDMVVGFGGGATTDLAGFLAASWLRGVSWVAVPTTVLAMVDAAVGGKTGINLGAGKNLVGAFHEPAAVLCDLDLLETVPEADLRSGLAEVAKAGFIADPRILEMIEEDPADAVTPGSERLAELIRRGIKVKAEVVAGDLRERTSSGAARGREILNYGHTLAHAIERHSGFSWRHGDAVAVGMRYAARLAGRLGLLSKALVMRHDAVLDALGLPAAYQSQAWPELREAMNLDKKTRGSQLRFVLLEDLTRTVIVPGPPEEALAAAYADLG